MPINILIQTEKGKLASDFTWTANQAVDFMNWYYDKGQYKAYLSDSFKTNIKNVFPIGTVEFIEGFLKESFNLPLPNPLNVPKQLFQFAGRDIRNCTEFNANDSIFWKSNDRIKGISGFSREKIEGKDEIIKGNFQVSSLVDIDSEWRAFVYRNNLVGLQNYSGDFAFFPNILEIKKMIKSWTVSPTAYTLDVFVNKKGTFVMECHDFFSCGLYGFYDYKTYLTMTVSWFREFLRKNNILAY